MKHLTVATLAILTLGACTQVYHKDVKDNAAFWERKDNVSALYMRGPKAQHQLHKDISSCVSEVKELSRLGTIRDANPPSHIEMGKDLSRDWQSPKGDGPLHTEFRDFHDFESCMNFKGWRRVDYVRHDQIKKSRKNYETTILGKPYQTVDDNNGQWSNNTNTTYNHND